MEGIINTNKTKKNKINKLGVELAEAVLDPVLDESIRPNSFDEVIGRHKEKEVIGNMIKAARISGKALDHILFHGPPGVGKTSLAMVIAKELGVNLTVISALNLTRPADVASILTGLPEMSVLFIDELHRIRPNVGEVFYPAMEDGLIDIILGKGPTAKTLRIETPKFTLVGATTRLASIPAPLRDRFGVDFRIEYYELDEIKQIITQKANKLGWKIGSEALGVLASRARKTPRIAIKLLKRVIDKAAIELREQIEIGDVRQTLTLLDIDEFGLDSVDRKIVTFLYQFNGSRPIGLKQIAVYLQDDPITVEDVYEPYLISLGLISRTPQGRIITQKGVEYINNYKLLNDN